MEFTVPTVHAHVRIKTFLEERRITKGGRIDI
jgi:hypothetical protein